MTTGPSPENAQGVNTDGGSVDQSVEEARQRRATIAGRMERALDRFGRLGRPPRLVAVSKTFDSAAIRPFLMAGQRLFGENRVQEAKAKWPELKQDFPDIELHLIGPLQTNKVREAVALFDVIQSLDREKLAGVLRAEMTRAGRDLPVFVQVNIGEESQKAGIHPGEAIAFSRRCRGYHGLDVHGFMCIPPDGVPPGPYFAQLTELARAAALSELSMGMSADFETAVGMGATLVRIGSALFGSRA